MTLFDDDLAAVRPRPRYRSASRDQRPGAHHGELVVSVLPDVPAMDRELHYTVPPALGDLITPGCIVRVGLHGRRVRGWVTALGVVAEADVELSAVTKFTGLAVDAEVIDLARWVAWRWVGRLPSVLRVATPDRVVSAPAGRAARVPDPGRAPQGSTAAFGETADLLGRGPGVGLYAVSPLTDPATVALAAAALGQALVVVPSVDQAARIAAVLARCGGTVARWPGGTASALAGHTVVGGHTAVLAPMPDLRAIVVIDEHDERLQNESSPTWHAREVAVERARRSGVPCLLVSPTPSLEALDASAGTSGAGGMTHGVTAGDRRRGWARVEVVDRRAADPHEGLFSQRFTAAARETLGGDRSVLCVLNRTGRAKLLACRHCGLTAACGACGAALRSVDDDTLECLRCGTSRPRICDACGSQAMKVLRMGVTRAREDLAALLREPVGLLTAAESELEGARVVMGTAAVLLRRSDSFARRVGLVALLDFDQDLTAARYRASEEALATLVNASRMVGGRKGSVLVQTRDPDHEVLSAAVGADPSRLWRSERARRELLSLPPASSIAAVGGEAAGEWIRRLGQPPDLRVQGPNDGWWLLRAANPATMADAAGAVERPPGRLRLRVDPMSLPRT